MSKPNINIPAEFAVNGIKTPFSNAKVQNGFDRINPDVLAGDNLNQFIDDTYKGLNGVLELYEGCVLYDSTVTYTNKSLVFDITNDGIKFYHSLQNGNINHALTDADYWEEVNLGGSSRNVGEIISSTLPLTDAGLHLLDGTLLPYGIYKEFIDYIANLYAENPSANYFCTESDWQSSVSTYGVCGKFVYDSINNTVRLPKVTGKIDGTTDLNALGDLEPLFVRLPNITGSFSSSCDNTPTSSSGAFSTVSTGSYSRGPGNYWTSWAQRAFNASSSSSVYSGNGSDTAIHEQAIKCFIYIVIATSSKTEIQTNIDGITTDLNGKADVDLTNCTKPHIVETYQNGTSWYRVYSDGWCEQGGITAQNLQTIQLLKAYANTNYVVFGNIITTTDDNAYTGQLCIMTKETGSFSFPASSKNVRQWQACGYIN